MYVDGIILLIIYVMAASALLLAIYNRIEFKDLIKELRRPRIKKQQPKPPVKVQRSRGYWDKE